MKVDGKIHVAVVGLGWVATNRHIPLAVRHPDVKLYGVVDKHSERLQLVTQNYRWLKTSLSTDGEMPWGDDVQAVMIATDPLNHYALAKKMLLAGKHVLMEKPLTMSPDESRDLEQIAERSGLCLCVVHNFQFARSTRRLQQLLKEGRLGEIQAIEALQLSNPRRRLPVWYEQLPFGLFYDESPHLLYMLENLAAQPIQHAASTVVRRVGQNTPLSVAGQYVAGTVPVRLSMNFNAPVSEWHVAVMGSEGMGIVDLFRDILVLLPNDRSHKARDILTTTGSFIATHLAGFAASGIMLTRGALFYGTEIVWDEFVGAVQGRRAAKEISAARGRRVVELQHELMSKSAVIELPKDEDSRPQQLLP